jgi:hypothetical protein
MASLQKNVAGQNLTFCLVSTTTGLGVPGAAVSVTVVKDNGAQVAGTGTVTNKGTGQYSYGPVQAETNAADVGFMFSATGCIPCNLDFHTDLVDATGNLQVDAVRINNISAASVTAVNANVGTTQPANFTGTGGAALVNATATVPGTVNANVQQWNGTGVVAATAGIPDVNVKNINNISGAAVTTISANIGTTQPINFTGSGAAAFVQTALQQVIPGAISAAAFAAGALDAVWSTATRLLTAGTNIVLAKGTGVTGFNDLDAPGVRAAVGLASANLDAQLAPISSITAAPTAIQNADALLDRDMAAGVDSGGPTHRTMRQALRLLRNKWSTSGNSLLVMKEDDATLSWTSILATTPGAPPVTGSDPVGP